MSAILRITDGTNAIDLLSSSYGFHLDSWQQNIITAKSGGVFQDSPIAEGRQLVYRQLGNAVESYRLKLNQTSQDVIARSIQDLLQLLEEAERYWLKASEKNPVWIEARSTNETNTRYALIAKYQIPQLENPYAQPFLQPDCLALLDDFDLIIERQHWLSNEPGSDTAIQASNLQTVYREGRFVTGANTDTASVDDTSTISTSDPLDIGELSFINTPRDVGIRFQSCTIPQGATIVEARVELQAATQSSEVFTIISGEDTDDAATFSTWADFQGRTETSATLNWLIGATGSVSYSTVTTPDISPIIQEIVDRGGFSSGNDIVVFIKTDKSIRHGEGEVKGHDAGATFNTLYVRWTESNVFGRAATTTNEVYVANKFNIAQLTHVYSYDSSAATFSGNRLNTSLPYDIYPNAGIENGDIVYFGISDDVDNAIEGPFNSLVFDLVPFLPINITDFEWDYWNGAAWAPISSGDMRDNTGGVANGGASFTNAGVHSVHWQPDTTWAKTTINSVSAYWIRCEKTSAITATQEAQQQNRQIYTITQPYIDIASGQVLGDIRSISRTKVENQSGLPSGSAAESRRLIVGVKSLADGSDFVGYLNASNFQNGKGIFFAIGDDTTEGDAQIDTANGERSTFTATDTVQATRGYWDINDEVIDSYNGTYHVYFRGFFQNQAGSGFPKINIQVVTGSGGISQTGDQRAFATTSDWELLDLGTINIPASSTLASGEKTDTVRLNLQIQADTTADVVYLYDLILIPTSIWAGNFETGSNEYSNRLQRYFEVDSTTQPKSAIRGLLRSEGNDDILSTWTSITNSRFGLLGEENLRVVFLSARTSGSGWLSEPWVAHSVQVFNTNRYFSLRGDQ